MRIMSKCDVALCDFRLKLVKIKLQKCIKAMKGRYGSAEATSNLECAMMYINLCISDNKHHTKIYQQFRNPPNTPKSRRLGWHEKGANKVYEHAIKSGLVDEKNMIRFDCRFIWSQMPYEEGDAK